jgi:BA14K-like protein
MRGPFDLSGREKSMLRSKMVAAALALAMSLSVVPESFARGGFGGHFGGFGGAHFGGAHFGGAHFGGVGMRPAFAGVRPGFVRPGFVRPGFVGPRVGFFPHRRFFAPGFAFGTGLALGAYPYYDPYYYDPSYYDPGSYYGDVPPVTVSPDAVNYCMQRFRTYDPATGTYIGRGGVRRHCP